MKKLLLPIIAVFMAFTLAGCAPQLTAQEYYDALESNFTDYTEALSACEDAVDDSNYAEARVKADESEKLLNKIASLNAPEKYKDEQKELADGINKQKEGMKLLRESITIAEKNGTDSTEYAEIKAKMTEQGVDSMEIATTLLSLCLQLGMELN